MIFFSNTETILFLKECNFIWAANISFFIFAIFLLFVLDSLDSSNDFDGKSDFFIFLKHFLNYSATRTCHFKNNTKSLHYHIFVINTCEFTLRFMTLKWCFILNIDVIITLITNKLFKIIVREHLLIH